MKNLIIVFALLLTLVCCTTEAERNRMRSGLDSINVRNRTDQPFTPQDVQPYVHFFDNHGDANDRLLAHYLLGRAYHEKGDAPMALECYQHAIDCADTTAMSEKGFAQLSRVYAQMADIFYQQGLYREQLDHENRSVYYAWIGKDTLAALMNYEQESFAYERLGLKDSAIYVIEDVAQKYIKYGRPADAAISLGAIIRTLMDIGEFQKAKRYMDLYESKSGFFNSQGEIERGREIYYKAKGLYYLYNNRLDSAEYYFRKELCEGHDYNNQNAAAMGLALLYQQTQRTDSATKYAIYAYAMNDSLYVHRTTKTIERMQSLYDYSRHQEIAKRESERASSERSKRLFSVMLLLLIASLSTIVIYKMYVDREKRQALYLKNLEQLEQTQSDILLLRAHTEENEELIAEKERQLEKLTSAMYEYKKNAQSNNAIIDKQIKDSIIYHTLQKKQHGQKLTKDELRECRKLVLENLPRLNNFLLSKEYKLSNKDFNVCILFRLGFKSKEVSNMLDVTQGRISQISSKILQELFHENTGGASELIEKLYSI